MTGASTDNTQLQGKYVAETKDRLLKPGIKLNPCYSLVLVARHNNYAHRYRV